MQARVRVGARSLRRARIYAPHRRPWLLSVFVARRSGRPRAPSARLSLVRVIASDPLAVDEGDVSSFIQKIALLVALVTAVTAVSVVCGGWKWKAQSLGAGPHTVVTAPALAPE